MPRNAIPAGKSGASPRNSRTDSSEGRACPGPRSERWPPPRPCAWRSASFARTTSREPQRRDGPRARHAHARRAQTGHRGHPAPPRTARAASLSPNASCSSCALLATSQVYARPMGVREAPACDPKTNTRTPPIVACLAPRHAGSSCRCHQGAGIPARVVYHGNDMSSPSRKVGPWSPASMLRRRTGSTSRQSRLSESFETSLASLASSRFASLTAMTSRASTTSCSSAASPRCSPSPRPTTPIAPSPRRRAASSSRSSTSPASSTSAQTPQASASS